MQLQNHHHNNIQSRSPSSEEDNSPTEMNNCRRLIDKPPLVSIIILLSIRHLYYIIKYTAIISNKNEGYNRIEEPLNGHQPPTIRPRFAIRTKLSSR